MLKSDVLTLLLFQVKDYPETDPHSLTQPDLENEEKEETVADDDDVTRSDDVTKSDDVTLPPLPTSSSTRRRIPPDRDKTSTSTPSNCTRTCEEI